MGSKSSFKEIMYNEKWTKRLDDMFIEDLELWSVMEGRSLTINDHEAITKTVQSMNKLSSTHSFSYYDCHCRFELAHERFVTWNWIINFKDVEYEKSTNTATAAPDTWAYITSIHPKLGPAYEGGEREHMWEQLNEIFGGATTKKNGGAKMEPLIDLDDLLSNFERGTPKVSRIGTTKKEDSEVMIVGSYDPPQDVMSSNKGKGKCLLSNTEYVVPSKTGSTTKSGGTSKASCSSVKRAIIF